ncbi:MAG: hypothetical protein FJW30_24520 [Acidobacteria bacterium]|nr:hypothetical protein [Acidobacteriota bacterium]
MQDKSRQSLTPDEIAEMATAGHDVSRFFTSQFTVVKPVRRVNLDLALDQNGTPRPTKRRAG